MVALPAYMYRDPMVVLINKQEHEERRSCSGCAHAKQIVTPFGDTIAVCLKGKPYGKRCPRYEAQHVPA